MKSLEKCKCEKTAVYDLLRTAIVGGPVQVFTRHHEKDITCTKSHVYEEKSKLTKGVIGYDANGIYLYCSDNIMLCGKDTLDEKKKSHDQKRIAKLSEDVLKGEFFGFAQADIEVPDELYDRDIPEEMKIYKEKNWQKNSERSK